MDTQFWKDCGKQETEIFGSAAGQYNLPAIIKLAIRYGATIKDFSLDMSDEQVLENEFVCEAVEEAEQYLSKQLPDDYYFGNTENGDWGVYKVDAFEL